MISWRWFFQLVLSLCFLVIPFHGVSGAGDDADGEAAMHQDLSSYALGVDDRVSVIVYQEPDLSHSHTIAADGTITMPLVGVIDAAGLTVHELSREIQGRLADGYLVEPSVAIEVERYRPFYILGEVRAPGQYEYVNHITGLQAVALAGGFTYRAKQKRLKVKRSAAGDYYQFISAYDSILPGDVVVIEERFF